MLVSREATHIKPLCPLGPLSSSRNTTFTATVAQQLQRSSFPEPMARSMRGKPERIQYATSRAKTNGNSPADRPPRPINSLPFFGIIITIMMIIMIITRIAMIIIVVILIVILTIIIITIII